MRQLISGPAGRRPGGRRGLPLLALAGLLLLLGGCRASGPGTPARTVAGFFAKYEHRPGFHVADWSAGLLQRLTLASLGKLLGGSDLTNAITGIRTARALTFVPTSRAALGLSREGLTQEADGLLQAERYTPLAAATGNSTAYRYVVKASGDKVSELIAIGTLPDVTGSFVLAQVEGSFTRAQAEELSKVLPKLVQQTR